MLEPFIAPALYQKYPGTVDEWTLSEAMTADTASGGLQQQLENHYNTFVVRKGVDSGGTGRIGLADITFFFLRVCACRRNKTWPRSRGRG